MIISVPSSWNLSHRSFVSRRHWIAAISLDPDVLGERTGLSRDAGLGDGSPDFGDLKAPSDFVPEKSFSL